jgi:hypothetical protein
MHVCTAPMYPRPHTHTNEALRLQRRCKTNALERDIESTSIMLDTGTLRCIAHALKRQNFMCLASCMVRLGFSRRNTSHEHSCRTQATRHVRNGNTCTLCARSPSQAFALWRRHAQHEPPRTRLAHPVEHLRAHEVPEPPAGLDEAQHPRRQHQAVNERGHHLHHIHQPQRHPRRLQGRFRDYPMKLGDSIRRSTSAGTISTTSISRSAIPAGFRGASGIEVALADQFVRVLKLIIIDYRSGQSGTRGSARHGWSGKKGRPKS